MSSLVPPADLLWAPVGQIPLSPPFGTRLTALVVVEIVLAVLVVLLYFKYKALKSVPLDEWWARRLEKATPRMRRMIRESQEIYEEEQAAFGGKPGGPGVDERAPGPGGASPE
jgi:hypothetical protein